MATDRDTATRGEQTRQAILKAAQELFLSQGYNGTSMRQIARRAGGIAVGGIYNHFSSKEDLFRALLEVHSPYDEILELLENLDGEDGPDLIRKALPGLQKIMLENAVFFDLVLIDVREGGGNAIRRLGNRVFPHLVAFAQRVMAAGGLRSDFDTFTLMRLMASVAIGFLITEMIAYSEGRLLFPNVPDFDEAYWFDALVEFVLHGVAAPEGEQAGG